MAEHQHAQQPEKTDTTVKRQTPPQIQFPTSHPAAIIQRARINPGSLTHADVMQLQRTIGNRAVGRLLTELGLVPSRAKQAPPIQREAMPEEEELLQGKFSEPIQRLEEEEEEPLQMKSVVQREEIPEEEEEPIQGKFESEPEQASCPSCSASMQRENRTGMPDNLKAGVESLSGLDMSDVRVHYNSSKPAEVGALAYTQGTNIHVASGQERCLPHEAWHVVQQVQGRVQPTFQMRGVAVNDDERLEREADVMGDRAEQIKKQESYKLLYKIHRPPLPLKEKAVQKMKFATDGSMIPEGSASTFYYDTNGDIETVLKVFGSLEDLNVINRMITELSTQSRESSLDENESKVLAFLNDLLQKISTPPETTVHPPPPPPTLPLPLPIKTATKKTNPPKSSPLPVSNQMPFPSQDHLPPEACHVIHLFNTSGVLVSSIQSVHVKLTLLNAWEPSVGAGIRMEEGKKVVDRPTLPPKNMHPTTNWTLAHTEIIANYFQMTTEVGTVKTGLPLCRSIAIIADPSLIGDAFLSNRSDRLTFGKDACSSSTQNSINGQTVYSQNEARGELKKLLCEEISEQGERKGRCLQNTEIKTLGLSPAAVIGFISTNFLQDKQILTDAVKAMGARGIPLFPVFTWEIQDNKTVLRYQTTISRTS